MTQAIPKLITFDQFIAWYPQNTTQRYELHDGVIIEIAPPTGDHEEIVGFLVRKLSVELDRLNLPYFIPKTALVSLFRGSDRIQSPTFPELNLTAEQIFQAASSPN